jgi:hypothetical protein
MRIDQIVNTLRVSLDTYVDTLKGRLHVATDPWHPLEILAVSPRGCLVVLHWGGDEVAGQADTMIVARNVLEIYVGYGLGLQRDPDIASMVNRTDRPSLLKLVNDVRGYVLGCLFPADETERIPEYGGCVPVVLPSGFPLAAYKFTVRLDAAVDVGDSVELVTEPDP